MCQTGSLSHVPEDGVGDGAPAFTRDGIEYLQKTGARLLVRYDYNAVGVVALWLKTKARSFDAHFWGGASPAPFPIRQGKFPRGIANDAR
jgi:hypothetical protein